VGQRALKELVLRSPPRETLRLWVAGCATGQEAYTLAILLDEVIRESGKALDFKIFATDLDREAVDFAARGEYEESAVVDLGEERLQRHFVRRGELWVADRELRRRIVFAPHNIAQDPPFTRLDLVSCRNVLIYLGATLQKRVLGAFAFGLKPGAYLLLGTSEALGEAADRFRTVDSQAKLFQRTGGPHQLAGEGLGLAIAPPLGHSPGGRPPAQTEDQQATETAFRLLMEKFAPTSVLVREDLTLVSVFGNVQRFLTVPIGQASLSLPAMLQENLRLVTQMACSRALASGQDQTLAAQDGEGTLPVKVKPFTLPRSGRRYLVVVYGGLERETASAVIDASVVQGGQALELQRELQFVRESLQSTIEELETSSEELQATNEELLASNEELQSTNEELQSVNEELGTVNAEHQARIGELVAANADLDNLFRSTSIGILFLDEELRIRRFTPAVAAAFNVLERDEGRPIHHLTSRLQDRDLLPDMERVRDGSSSIEREVELLDGRHFMLKILPYVGIPTRRGVVITLIETTQLRAALRGVEQLQLVIDSLREHVAVVDGKGIIRLVNAAWHRFAITNGGDPYRVGPGADYLAASAGVPAVQAGIKAVLARETPLFQHEYPSDGGGVKRWFLLYCSPLSGQSGAVISHIDITDRHADVVVAGAR
jgi:two-component system CheB/CheR fusion protein